SPVDAYDVRPEQLPIPHPRAYSTLSIDQHVERHARALAVAIALDDRPNAEALIRHVIAEAQRGVLRFCDLEKMRERTVMRLFAQSLCMARGHSVTCINGTTMRRARALRVGCST